MCEKNENGLPYEKITLKEHLKNRLMELYCTMANIDGPALENIKEGIDDKNLPNCYAVCKLLVLELRKIEEICEKRGRY